VDVVGEEVDVVVGIAVVVVVVGSGDGVGVGVGVGVGAGGVGDGVGLGPPMTPPSRVLPVVPTAVSEQLLIVIPLKHAGPVIYSVFCMKALRKPTPSSPLDG